MSKQEQIAQRDWHTRARARIIADAESSAVEPDTTRRFHAGEECVLLQWGNAGYPVMRQYWWDSRDIDGAHIILADKVKVIEVLDEVLP